MRLSTLIELNSVRLLTKSVYAVTIGIGTKLRHRFPFIEFETNQRSNRSIDKVSCLQETDTLFATAQIAR